MKTIPVGLKTNPYRIVVGHHMLDRLGLTLKRLNIGRDAVIITNPKIHAHHGRVLISGLKRHGFSTKVFTVPAGERSKSSRAAFRLIEQIARYGRLKGVFIIAFGGGVVGDLAGYVAAAYKRGIPYVQVPTSLLAQVDSAIGGKVGLDLPCGKNLVGAVYQPKIVWSDVGVLSTLAPRQIRNGLAEIIKYGVIADAKFLDYVTRHHTEIMRFDPDVLVSVVARASRIKRDVVLKDEKDTKGIRAILNFGHTIGHAIEAAGKYDQHHHGEAIALGMRVAAEISYRKKMCSAKDVAALNAALSLAALPERIRDIRTKDILTAMQHDKKFLPGKNRFVLMQKIGKAKLVADVSPAVITRAIRAYQSQNKD